MFIAIRTPPKDSHLRGTHYCAQQSVWLPSFDQEHKQMRWVWQHSHMDLWSTGYPGLFDHHNCQGVDLLMCARVTSGRLPHHIGQFASICPGLRRRHLIPTRLLALKTLLLATQTVGTEELVFEIVENLEQICLHVQRVAGVWTQGLLAAYAGAIHTCVEGSQARPIAHQHGT